MFYLAYHANTSDNIIYKFVLAFSKHLKAYVKAQSGHFEQTTRLTN